MTMFKKGMILKKNAGYFLLSKCHPFQRFKVNLGENINLYELKYVIKHVILSSCDYEKGLK